MKILVVCGAGASSSFVAHRIRRLARERGLEVDVVPTSDSLLEDSAQDASVVLLGAHLASQADAIRIRLAVTGDASVVVLPEAAFTDQSGAIALDSALDAVGIRP
ncbi:MULTISPECIES: PTS sugar transporter subunit IIB [unclassified Leifsonia]|uniref:PTS sugar transporter subunit IIB n=1 Tax=unclassified Leifsonia TaxID=2663824 RepID=UPI0006FF27B9|nr:MULTISPECIES: hypothetical protein [unclassified Leifsonia]KQX07923.1 hypothetical protein ASC59_09470 [Leifsonia sp. Root1293]KRA12204.1 hypothetical protein ASD61_09470 [Leifsonia sp. Root60]